MRLPRLLLPILALSFGFTLAACAGADDPQRVPSDLKCNVGGTVQSCSLTLTAPAGYKITLVSRSCNAINNDISLTSPLVVTLTTDACREAIGTVWDYSTPIQPANTKIDIVFTSDQFANAPGTRVVGAYPNWTVNFEDGGDADFNDVVLSVEAVPET